MFESWPEMWGGGYPAYRTTLRKFLWFRTVTGGNAPEFKTVTGKIVDFVTKRIAPLKIEADLEPIQSGTGDPSPENVRPISGHTGAVLDVTGKNIFDKNMTFTKSYYIAADGSETFNASYMFSDYIPVKPSTNYIFSGTIVSNQMYNAVAFYDTEKNFLSRFLPNGSGIPAAFATPNNCGFIRFNASNNYSLDDVQLEQGTVASSYEPFGTTVTVNFGSTVYGGKLTVNEDGTGTVVSEWAKMGDLSTVGATTDTLNGLPCVSVVNNNLKNSDNKKNVMSSAFKFLGNAASDAAVGGMVNRTASYYNLGFCSPNNFTTVAEFRSWVSANDIDVVYKLLEPITISLSPGQVNALLGNNTVWVDDSDSISVTYRSN